MKNRILLVTLLLVLSFFIKKQVLAAEATGCLSINETRCHLLPDPSFCAGEVNDCEWKSAGCSARRESYCRSLNTPDLCKTDENNCVWKAPPLKDYIYWSKNTVNGDCECHKDFLATDIDQAKGFLEQISPLPEPCSGSATNINELATYTRLGEGVCPEVNSTQQITYHCTVVDDKVGEHKLGDCVPFLSVDNDTTAREEGNKVCAASSGAADRVEVVKGECPSAGASSGPQAGASVKDLQNQAKSELNKANFSGPADLINRAIRILMAFIGSIALVLYIYSGFLWMTASGNAEQAGKAKTTMVWTTLGVLMMLASYVLASFIFKSLGV